MKVGDLLFPELLVFIVVIFFTVTWSAVPVVVRNACRRGCELFPLVLLTLFSYHAFLCLGVSMVLQGTLKLRLNITSVIIGKFRKECRVKVTKNASYEEKALNAEKERK
jgi:hypothetical protein